jgi:hypothetical protein
MLAKIDSSGALRMRFVALWLSFAVALAWLPAAGFARTTFEIVRRSKPLLIIRQPCDPEKAGFHRIAFSPNGKDLLAISGDGILRVWDSITGKEARHVQLPAASQGVFCKDTQRLALHDCYRADGFLRVHNTASGKEVFRSQHGWREYVGCPAISPDGPLDRMPAGGTWTHHQDLGGWQRSSAANARTTRDQGMDHEGCNTYAGFQFRWQTPDRGILKWTCDGLGGRQRQANIQSRHLFCARFAHCSSIKE